MTTISFGGINFTLTAKTAEKATHYIKALECAKHSHDYEDWEYVGMMADLLASDLSYEEWYWL